MKLSFFYAFLYHKMDHQDKWFILFQKTHHNQEENGLKNSVEKLCSIKKRQKDEVELEELLFRIIRFSVCHNQLKQTNNF